MRWVEKRDKKGKNMKEANEGILYIKHFVVF